MVKKLEELYSEHELSMMRAVREELLADPKAFEVGKQNGGGLQCPANADEGRKQR